MGSFESNCISPIQEIPYNCRVIKFPNDYSCCFINSVTQCLLNLEYIQQYLIYFGNCVKQHGFDEIFSGSILGNLYKIFVMSANTTKVDNTHYLELIYSSFKEFKPGKESDAHELLLSLISSFDKTVDQFNELLGKDEFPHFSLIFQLHVSSLVQCGCGKSFNFDEKYNIVSVPVKSNIVSSIQKFLEPNKTLAYDTVCHKNLNYSSFKQITLFPKVIALQLLRFSLHNGNYQKNSNCTKIFQEINLPNYGNKIKYELNSLVIHLGKHIQNGHYLSVYKSNDNWIFADDENIRALSQEEIDELFEFGMVRSPYPSPSVYLLFYSLKTDNI